MVKPLGEDVITDPANLPITAKEMRELIKVTRQNILGDALPNLEKQDRMLLADSVNPDTRRQMQSEGDQIGIERDLNFKIADEYRVKLNELDKMEERIQSKKFTKCVNCNGEIPPARLRIRPNSIYCVPCSGKISLQNKTPVQAPIEE